jgi:hypothetical protein
MDPYVLRDKDIPTDRMTMYYLTIVDELQYNELYTYLNETIEGAQAAIDTHVKDVLDIDAEEEIEKHMAKMETHRRVEFTIGDGDNGCKIQCRMIQLGW